MTVLADCGKFSSRLPGKVVEHMVLVRMVSVILLLAAAPVLADTAPPIVREEQQVTVNGVDETWRLEWAKQPKPTCAPDQPEWVSCPCNGFAFGERGTLVLVRKRPGQEDERLELNQFFGKDLDSPADPGEAVLRRWNVDDKDIDKTDTPGFAALARRRPNARVMRLADYDHDGEATEFLLQVGTLPCGKEMMVAVGVSRVNPRLHAFRTVERPKKPLILQASHWQALLDAQGPVTVLDWRCADHGSETETDLELSADAGRIHAKKIEYQCTEKAARGPEVGREDL
jgi:hypothetical protein